MRSEPCSAYAHIKYTFGCMSVAIFRDARRLSCVCIECYFYLAPATCHSTSKNHSHLLHSTWRYPLHTTSAYFEKSTTTTTTNYTLTFSTTTTTTNCPLVHLNRFIRPQLVSACLAGGPHHDRKCRRCCHPQRHRNRSQTAGNVYRKRITGKLNQYNCNSIIVALIIERRLSHVQRTAGHTQPHTHTHTHFQTHTYSYMYKAITYCNDIRLLERLRFCFGLPFSS